MPSSSKGDISTILHSAIVEQYLMGCAILFKAFGAVYKKLFYYALILTFVYVGSSHS